MKRYSWRDTLTVSLVSLIIAIPKCTARTKFTLCSPLRTPVFSGDFLEGFLSLATKKGTKRYERTPALKMKAVMSEVVFSGLPFVSFKCRFGCLNASLALLSAGFGDSSARLRWPGKKKSRCESGRSKRKSICENRFAETPLSDNVRAIRANHIKPAIRNF